MNFKALFRCRISFFVYVYDVCSVCFYISVCWNSVLNKLHKIYSVMPCRRVPQFRGTLRTRLVFFCGRGRGVRGIVDHRNMPLPWWDTTGQTVAYKLAYVWFPKCVVHGSRVQWHRAPRHFSSPNLVANRVFRDFRLSCVVSECRLYFRTQSACQNAVSSLIIFYSERYVVLTR